MEILRKRADVLLAEKNARAINIDATVIAEAPKIAPHIAADAREDRGRAGDVTFRASASRRRRTKGLGTIGRGEGMAAMAMAVVEDR